MPVLSEFVFSLFDLGERESVSCTSETQPKYSFTPAFPFDLKVLYCCTLLTALMFTVHGSRPWARVDPGALGLGWDAVAQGPIGCCCCCLQLLCLLLQTWRFAPTCCPSTARGQRSCVPRLRERSVRQVAVLRRSCPHRGWVRRRLHNIACKLPHTLSVPFTASVSPSASCTCGSGNSCCRFCCRFCCRSCCYVPSSVPRRGGSCCSSGCAGLWGGSLGGGGGGGAGGGVCRLFLLRIPGTAQKSLLIPRNYRSSRTSPGRCAFCAAALLLITTVSRLSSRLQCCTGFPGFRKCRTRRTITTFRPDHDTSRPQTTGPQ